MARRKSREIMACSRPIPNRAPLKEMSFAQNTWAAV
jgi:hypothetical protein